MPLVLRKTRTNLIWDDPCEGLPWLDIDDIPADPVTDLETHENNLSIYVIQDDKSELDRCLSALAAQRAHLHKLDYILFDISLIDSLHLEIDDKEKGTLLDQEVNLLHRNIIKLSANKLIKLSKGIIGNCVGARILDDEVARLISTSIKNGWINKSKIDNLVYEISKKFPSIEIS